MNTVKDNPTTLRNTWKRRDDDISEYLTTKNRTLDREDGGSVAGDDKAADDDAEHRVDGAEHNG